MFRGDDVTFVMVVVARQSGGVLPDGRYDVIVVDATETRLELALLGGEHKGEVIALRTPGVEVEDPLALLGVPGTLTVEGGVPTFVAEP